MRELVIPEEFRSLPVQALRVSQRVENRLLAAGISQLGQLHGLTASGVAAIRQLGVVAFQEIMEAVAALEPGAERPVSRPEDQFAWWWLKAGEEEEAARQIGEPLHVPAHARDWPLEALGLSGMAEARLRSQGILTLGDLDGRTVIELLSLGGIGVKSTAPLARAVAALENLPPAEVFRSDASGAHYPPNISLEVFRAVARAATPEDEIRALLSGMKPRNAGWVRRRWTRTQGRQVTLDEIAEEYGVSRERVRQVTQKGDERIAESNVRLPKLSAVVDLIEQGGGALPEPELLCRADAAGLPVDARVLSVLESLGRLNVVPQVTWNVQWRIWLTEAGIADWIDGGRAREVFAPIRAAIRLQLHSTGCISSSVFSDAPFGAEHALSLLRIPGRELHRVGTYLVPLPSGHSVLARWTEQMLAVAPELALEDIAAGLRRSAWRRNRSHVRLDVPPLEVLKAVLTGNAAFAVSADLVRLTDARPRQEVLTPTEATVVSVIESKGNVATWQDIMSACTKAGCAVPTIALALRQPFIAKKGAGLYALRGRAIAPAVLQARARERAAARREAVKRVVYSGGTTARVVYQLTNFSVGGVLPVPSKLRDLTRKTWTARLPGGRMLPVKVKEGFIWPLRRWFSANGLKVGDIIIADFDIATGVIQFDVA